MPATDPTEEARLATLPANDAIFPAADGVADTEASVLCPYCAERVTLALDPGSGTLQQYAEECEVCCRSMLLTVRYGPDGAAGVEVDREEDA